MMPCGSTLPRQEDAETSEVSFTVRGACGQGGAPRLQVGSQEVQLYVLRLEGRASFPNSSPFFQPALSRQN